MENKVLELLESAKKNIEEATTLVNDIKIVEKVGESYVITDEFERAVAGVEAIESAVEVLSGRNAKTGVLDRLTELVKDKLKTFFKENHKQKKYEGKYMEMGFKVVSRKVVDGKPEAQFIKLVAQPNTEAINAYMKATKSEENPDGKLPEGIKENRFEYVTYKPVLNETE